MSAHPQISGEGRGFRAGAEVVSCIVEMDSSCDLIGIDVPESLPVTAKGRSPRARYSCWGRCRKGRLRGPAPEAIFVMEACGSAHHWARKVEDLGQVVVLLPPHLVRPYVPRNKIDRADARTAFSAQRGNAEVPAYRHAVPRVVRPV